MGMEDRMKRSQLSKGYNDILVYLNKRYPEYVSPTQVGNVVGGLTSTGRPRHSAWASPKLQKLVRWHFVERSSNGHYKALVA